MARNILKLGFDYLTGNKQVKNAYNQSFYEWMGIGFVKYDQKNQTYLDKGYNENPTVFSIINKSTVKLFSFI